MRGLVLVVALAGCGRLGFGSDNMSIVSLDGATPANDAAKLGDAASSAPPRYVGAFARASLNANGTVALAAQATAAGDLVLLEIGCNSSNAGGYTVTGPGWTFTQVGDPLSVAVKELHAQLFSAIAPNTDAVQLELTVGQCPIEVIGDELANVAIDTSTGMSGQGSCSAAVTTGKPDALIWAACVGGLALGPDENGFTTTALTPDGDYSAYHQTTDVADTNETVTFAESSTSLMYVVSLVAP